jgi:hypothetical protein
MAQLACPSRASHLLLRLSSLLREGVCLSTSSRRWSFTVSMKRALLASPRLIYFSNRAHRSSTRARACEWCC